MTFKQFYAKLKGFEWTLLQDNRNRAELIAAIANYSGNLRKGTPPFTVDRLRPIKSPPRNIFFRGLFGLG
ncbi:MAG: hypothetical protein ACW99G_17595 [Candidatus Thorarchaeota archaeon]|jgi:hypothetical protein